MIFKSIDDLNNYNGILALFGYENMGITKLISDKIPQEVSELVSFKYEDEKDLILNIDGKLKRILFVGVGEKDKITKTKIREVIGKIARKYKKDEICLYVDELVCDKFELETICYETVYSSIYSRYDFKKFTQKDEKDLKQIYITSKSDINNIISSATTDANCVNYARDLGNTPGNYMTPEILSEKAEKLAKELNVYCEILGNDDLKKLNAGALLGVNKGSSHEARMITLKYEGNPGADYIAFVGKGLTFDSGGYNLKPTTAMTGMKYDMCGGASVIAIFEMIVRRKEKLNIMAVIPATENKIGPDGYTCDDVLISMSGKSIEITNTDAEGRLILCDALTYAQKQGAKTIIDIATLTGACVVALGKNYTGAFSNNQEFINKLINTSKFTEEKIWQLPLDEDFNKQVRESNVADITNAVSGGAGSSLGAAFLQEFIEDGVNWIHLDIAGTSDTPKQKPYAAKGATGAVIRTVAEMFRS